MQSRRNLAHSCWPRVDQRLPPAASLFSTCLDCLECRLGQGLSLCRIVLELALPLFESAREASEAPSAIVHGKSFLQVTVVPISVFAIVQIILFTPAHMFYLFSLLPIVVFIQSPPQISVLAEVFPTRSNSSLVSFRSFIVLFVCTSSSIIALLAGTATLNC